MSRYLKRVADGQLQRKLHTHGATLIVGPKGCGKTTTAKQFAKSVVEFQDEDQRENLLLIANTKPSDLLLGDKPRLFDEWQDAPKLWGAIRKNVDDTGNVGDYILTGSTSKKVDTPHSGTMRITKMKMYPMSLFETGESNGTVSLANLFDSPKSYQVCHSSLTIDGVKQAVCRGGWPSFLHISSEEEQLDIATDLLTQICEVDISTIDGVKRSPLWTRTILRSYARNICTLASAKTIYEDAAANHDMSKDTFYDYVNALKELFIIEDIEAWNPAIRSKTAIRSSAKRNFTDPSIGAAALGLTPAYFASDYKTLGFLFESLVMRDLKIYSSANGGYLSYYRDRYGLEADAVLHLADGRYALIEIKLGESQVEEGAAHLTEIEQLVVAHNKTEKQAPLRIPDLKLVITATEYGYRRDDGVLVIPIGCLAP